MSYLSKRGFVIKKNSITDKELTNLKLELKGKPLVDSKFNFKQENPSYPIYIETKNKIYIPKMYGIEKFGFPDTVLENYIGKEWNNHVEFNGTLLDRQVEPVNALIKACEEKGGGILDLQTGFGKCHGFNTDILMYDGNIKKVQDIQEGELLMGDDSTQRKVLSLARGEDLMYDIIPIKGEKYTVNQEHILCLKISGKPTIRKYNLKNFKDWGVRWFENNKYNTKTFKKEKDANIFLKNIKQQDIMEISVKDYIKLPKTIKHVLKGYKVPIEFHEKELKFDPYIIGLWLGDGTTMYPEITNQDSSIIKYLEINLKKYDCYLQYKNDKTNNYTYRINGNGTGLSNCNSFLNELNNKNLINNKYIPTVYKCNSRENRLKLLAGLLDSDGYLCHDKCTFEFSQKSEKLIDDVIYLCRSLGFSCYKNKEKKGCWYKDEYKEDYYYRINISGYGTHEIPTLCPRKKANKRKQIKDVLVTGITVKEVGYDNYYGFEIDGNHKYLMGDFTVTHNTVCMLYVLSKLKGKAIIVVNKIPLMNQWKSEISKFLPGIKVGTLQGQKNVDIVDCDIIVAMLQSMARIDYPDELFKDINVCVIDETHNLASKVFSQILFKLCCKYTIGLSATPKRADGCEYVFKWHLGDIVYKSSEKRKGKPPIIRLLKIDTNDYKEVSTENKFTGQKQIQFTSMLSELVEMPKRNLLILELIKDLIKKDNGRRILVLSDRRNHLLNLKETLDNDLDITFTYGLFLGSMKQADLTQSRAAQIVLATYAAFGEGVSERDLDTLILTSPKKYIGHLEHKMVKNESFKIEQIVGRIFRKDHIERNPIIVDLQDNFSVYKSQGKSRVIFYKQHFTNGIFEEQSINLDDHENVSVTFIKTKKRTEQIEKIEELENNILNKCCIIDD